MGDISVKVGNLNLIIEHRTFGGDGGPAVRVVGDVEGESVQLLRFDCFVKNPHYHYDPDDKNEMWSIDQVVVPDPIGWTITQLRERLPAMIEAAGFAATAASVDVEGVRDKLEQVEHAMRHP